MKIGIDVDGVLASFEAGYAPLLTAESGIEFPRLGEVEWPDVWDWEKEAGVDEEQYNHVWGKIEASEDFWFNLPPHKGAEEFLKHLNLMEEDDIFFITNRPGKTAGVQTEEWLVEHGFELPVVLVTSKKAKACNDFEIDLYLEDRIENVCDVVTNSPNTKCYMLARPWNKAVPGAERLPNLNAFLEIILEATHL